MFLSNECKPDHIVGVVGEYIEPDNSQRMLGTAMSPRSFGPSPDVHYPAGFMVAERNQEAIIGADEANLLHLATMRHSLPCLSASVNVAGVVFGHGQCGAADAPLMGVGVPVDTRAGDEWAEDLLRLPGIRPAAEQTEWRGRAEKMLEAVCEGLGALRDHRSETGGERCLRYFLCRTRAECWPMQQRDALARVEYSELIAREIGQALNGTL